MKFVYNPITLSGPKLGERFLDSQPKIGSLAIEKFFTKRRYILKLFCIHS